jgi:hypothetical protein
MKIELPEVTEVEPGRVIVVDGHRFVNQNLALVDPSETDHYVSDYRNVCAYQGTIWAREDALPVAS